MEGGQLLQRQVRGIKFFANIDLFEIGSACLTVLNVIMRLRFDIQVSERSVVPVVALGTLEPQSRPLRTTPGAEGLSLSFSLEQKQ